MLLSEKLLENAQAAIDEARQYADEINRLSQRVQELELSLNETAQGKAEEATKRQQVEEELQHLKAENRVSPTPSPKRRHVRRPAP